MVNNNNTLNLENIDMMQSSSKYTLKKHMQICMKEIMVVSVRSI